jgi:hypothetical protein
MSMTRRIGVRDVRRIGRMRRMLLAASLVVPFSAAISPARADATCTNYSATAAADALRKSVGVPGFLVVEEADEETVAAQSHVDSLGQSTTYAGFVYSVAAASNAGFAGVDPASVPLTATSSYPSRPTAESSTAAGSVNATSDNRSSTGAAQVNNTPDGTPGRSFARTTASCTDDGTITASAETVSEAVSFGNGTLRIGRLRSAASATIDTTGKLTTASTLQVEGFTVLGQTGAVTDQGIVLGDSSVPASMNPVAKGLQDAGIALSYASTSKDADGSGVVAPALAVTVEHPVAGVGTGPAAVTYTFGRAHARATTAAGGEPPLATNDATSVAGPPTTSAGRSGPTGGAAATPASGGAHPQPAPPRSTVSLAGLALGTGWASHIYLAILVGAGLLSLAVLIFRRFGVTRWT